MKSGVELIAEERQRQILQEGFTSEHDDSHRCRALVNAAMCYANALQASDDLPARWPWEESWWKPSNNPIRNLVKAGALLAAEIDRKNRFEEGLTTLADEEINSELDKKYEQGPTGDTAV